MEECRQRKLSDYPPVAQSANMGNGKKEMNMTQLLLLGKYEYGGGPIFKVVLEC